MLGDFFGDDDDDIGGGLGERSEEEGLNGKFNSCDGLLGGAEEPEDVLRPVGLED